MIGLYKAGSILEHLQLKECVVRSNSEVVGEIVCMGVCTIFYDVTIGAVYLGTRSTKRLISSPIVLYYCVAEGYLRFT